VPVLKIGSSMSAALSLNSIDTEICLDCIISL
jgi:hypothetical protein